MQGMWWSNANEPGEFIGRKPRQRRQQQAQFADTAMHRQDFDQAATRPAAAWQLTVKLGKARRHAG